jgi:hypothetical protein
MNRGHSQSLKGPPIFGKLKDGGCHDQTLEKAGTPHGGDHLGHPGEAVGRAAEWQNGSLNRRGIAAKLGMRKARFLPGARLALRGSDLSKRDFMARRWYYLFHIPKSCGTLGG